MKHILISLALINGVTAYAQNTVQVKSSGIQKTKKVRVIAKEEKCSATCKDYADWHTTTDTILVDTLKGAKTDTTELKIGNTRVIIIGEPKIERIERIEEEDIAGRKQEEENAKKAKVAYDFFDIDFGFLGMMPMADGGLSANDRIIKSQLELDRAKSTYVGIHIVNVTIPVIKNYMQLSTGVGLEYNNYRFTKNISFVPERDSLAIINDTIDFQKNKLLTRYLIAPLMLQFQTNPRQPKRSFKLAVGAEFGYLLGAKTKQISKERGKETYKDDFNAAPLHIALVGRIGYGNIGVFAKYYPDPETATIFKDKSPTPIAFGITTRF